MNENITNISSLDLAKVISQTNGRFFTCCFRKKNGELRRLNGRLGVTCHLRGGQRTTDPARFLVVWDRWAQDYRSVNVETIQWVKADRGVWMMDPKRGSLDALL